MIQPVRWLALFLILSCGLISGYATAAQTNATGSGFIVVTNPPVADFFTSNQYGSAPFTVSFSDSSSGREPLTYLWSFGDGSTSRLQNPTHTYRTNGEYTVSLTVTNSYGQDTKNLPGFIGVGNPPLSDFSVSDGQGEAPFTVTFTDTTRNRPVFWNWDFGDNTSSSLQNPPHTYAKAGIYSVTLKVGNHFGSGSLTRSNFVLVRSPAGQGMPGSGVPEETRAEGIVGLIQEARGTTDKNLPTAGFIPPQFMALAAVITSIAIVVLQVLFSSIGVIVQVALKFSKFFTDLIGGHAVEKASAKEIEQRGITFVKRERHFLGLSAVEILIVEAAVIIVALAFIVADRAELTLQVVLIYMLVGAISVILHDFAHRYVMTKHGHEADIQFWGLGTVIMFVTAWLYGNAFAQSYRNLAKRVGEDNPRETGLEMVAGPCVSIVLMVLFLSLMQMGGLFATAGGIGFTINLMTALYSLMPIETMDGLAIWKWNRAVFLVLFVPMIALYFFTYVMVS
jgi:PKD repeat protein